jgi:hypothetical protein
MSPTEIKLVSLQLMNCDARGSQGGVESDENLRIGMR